MWPASPGARRSAAVCSARRDCGWPADWIFRPLPPGRRRPGPRPSSKSGCGAAPSHLDTFDPKPEAGNDYCGPLKTPIETNVPGINICELLPLLAKQADKYSLIRSMTHGNNAHETASYMVQTGRPPGGRNVFPCVGAVVSLFKGYDAGYKGLIPPYIVLTEPQGRFSEAGFLGSRYKPFATGGDPAKTPFAVEGVVAPGIIRPAAKKPARAAAQIEHAGARPAGQCATGGIRPGRTTGL